MRKDKSGSFLLVVLISRLNVSSFVLCNTDRVNFKVELSVIRPRLEQRIEALKSSSLKNILLLMLFVQWRISRL
jgi:hypothetical protein